MTRYTRAALLKVILVVSVLLALAYAGLLIWFRLNEDTLLFHPEPGPLGPPPPGLKAKDVAFDSEGGITLKARVMQPLTSGLANGWVLYFHGAAGNVGTPGYNEAWAKFCDAGLGVFAVDYRGYGESTGMPSERGFYIDALSAYRYLHETLHVPPSRIVIYGYSLGSAVAIDLATQVEAAGLIVEGALTSVPARASELYPYVPAQRLARNRFASIDKIGKVTMPVLFVHARADEAIPLSHAQRLYARTRAPKRLQEVDGGHTTAFKVDPAFFTAIKGFVTSLGIPTE